VRNKERPELGLYTVWDELAQRCHHPALCVLIFWVAAQSWTVSFFFFLEIRSRESVSLCEGSKEQSTCNPVWVFYTYAKVPPFFMSLFTFRSTLMCTPWMTLRKRRAQFIVRIEFEDEWVYIWAETSRLHHAPVRLRLWKQQQSWVGLTCCFGEK
jgi:hypothetical protein